MNLPAFSGSTCGARTSTPAASSCNRKVTPASLSPQPRFRACIAICSARFATGIGTSYSRPSSFANSMSLRDSSSAKLARSKSPRNRLPGMPRCRMFIWPSEPRRTHSHKRFGVHARLDAKRQPLGYGLAHAVAYHVVYQLADAARAYRAGVEDLVAERVQHRLDSVIDFAFAAHHHGQVAGDGPGLAAADRGVQRVRALLSEQRLNLPYQRGAACGQVHIDASGLDAVQHALHSGGDGLDFGRTRQRREGHVAQPRHVRGGTRQAPPRAPASAWRPPRGRRTPPWGSRRAGCFGPCQGPCCLVR